MPAHMPARTRRSRQLDESPSNYVRRRPEETVLYQIVAQQLETFLARAEQRDRLVPRFVVRELRGFLDCGILARGFLRVHCDACGRDRLVAFSCKGRGVCPSCGGRRMADTAAHLVDRVLPRAPVRQWVLTVPFALRFRMAYDAGLAAAVLQLFVRAVFASLRRRARARWAISDPLCGAVTFVQRFGDALNLNVHFHLLALDGVYDPGDPQSPRFRPLPPPDDDEVAGVCARIVRRLARLLERRGLADAEDVDPLYEDQPLLAGLYGASVRGRIATGGRAGRRVTRLGDRIDAEDLGEIASPRCASVAGVSLHANVGVPAGDRLRLERLCRYVARSPLASERLSRLADGRLLYRLKNRWRDGSTHVLFEPQELLEKLVALVPPPRFNLVRYHGVFAPRSAWRAAIVPARSTSRGSVEACDHGTERPAPAGAAEERPESAPGAKPARRHPAVPPLRLSRYYTWAELMRRVFALDVLECAHCHARLRILAAIHPPQTTRVILEHLGLPARAPPVAAATTDEQFPSDDVSPECADVFDS